MEETRRTITHYERELQEIKQKPALPGGPGGEGHRERDCSLLERNSDLARQVIEGDAEIDKLDTEIEEQWHTPHGPAAAHRP